MLVLFIVMDPAYICNPVALLLKLGMKTVPSTRSKKGPVIITADIKIRGKF